jgi:aspartate aminotransferase
MLNPGDEVIVLAPYWATYVEQIKLAGGKPVAVECGSNFQPALEAIEAAITDKTKIVLVNSPCNPSGAVFSEKLLRGIASMAVERGIYVVSDECYEKFVYGEARHYSIASFGGDIAGRTITINAFSKTYAMTGWRVGYAVCPVELVKAVSSLQGQTTSNVNSIAQRAALAALRGSQECVAAMAMEFGKRRKVALRGLNEIDGVQCGEQFGAFYLFQDVSALYNDRIKDSAAFCDFLLEEAGVGLVPGSAFGVDRCVRFSYAASLESIERGVERIKEATKKL